MTPITLNNVAMESCRNNNARGLLMVRSLAIMQQQRLVPGPIPTLGSPTGHPEVERTLANEREAISHAASAAAP